MTRTPIPATSGTSEGEEPVPSTFTGNFGTTTGAREVQYNGKRERAKYVTTKYMGYDGFRFWNSQNMRLLVEAREHLDLFRDLLIAIKVQFPDVVKDHDIHPDTEWKLRRWLDEFERQRVAANTVSG
jgi:hypothetical protein